MTSPHTPHPMDLREDVRSLIATRIGRISRVVDLSETTLNAVVDNWWKDLLDHDPAVSRASIIELIRTCYPDGRIPPDLWARPFGQFVIATIGYHMELVPISVVALMLGYSRQAVYQMGYRGALERVKHDGMWFVTADSLQKLYANRGPRTSFHSHYTPRMVK